jgi:hypothetical protein
MLCCFFLGMKSEPLHVGGQEPICRNLENMHISHPSTDSMYSTNAYGSAAGTYVHFCTLIGRATVQLEMM